MKSATYFWRALGVLVFIGLVIGSTLELFDVAWGTGSQFGGFSFTWFILFTAYCTSALLLGGAIAYGFRNENFIPSMTAKITAFRERLGFLRPFLIVLILLLPSSFLQFTIWGIVFQGIYIRSLIWAVMLATGTVLAAKGKDLTSWNSFLAMLILSASVFSIFAALRFVTSYPFSLGWSEGNRLWDYSVMFGRGRYNYPADKNIFVFLETGRQFVGAIPFLLPSLSIKAARLWVNLLTVFPYILLGIASFRSLSNKKILWLLLSLWTYLFLGQGPIHAPLLLGAVLVALAWRSSLWIAIPILILSGYYISISRFTWIFAPAIWIFILEIRNFDFKFKELFRSPILRRAVILAASSLVGSIILPMFIPLQPTSIVSSDTEIPGILKLTQGLQENLSRQPLLWYRLLPNETYGYGILLGALLVTVPFVFLLYYLIKQKQFIKNKFLLLLFVLSSLAFFGMGLIVSTKIGGGGDLHNLDMFLISLFFIIVLIITNGGRDWIENIHTEPAWVKILLLISLILPALRPLQAMRSYGFVEQSKTLLILTGRENIKPLDLYPPQDVIDQVLATLKFEVDQARLNGEILFMDQRQLLTFGFISDVPLVPDYDKKLVMEQALASDQAYFDGFYEDLQNKRFSLIIVQPQFIVEKGGDEQFGEENDAWVKWVSKPLLCFYEIKGFPKKLNQEMRDIGIQLLTPKPGTMDCSESTP